MTAAARARADQHQATFSLGGDGAKPALSHFRPIQYLGSKLRLLDAITDAVTEAAPTSECVCDIFSGSAVVSRALAERWRVCAVDVQEYAALLARALLSGVTVESAVVTSIVAQAREGRTARLTRDVFSELISYENKCIDQAKKGDPIPLAELVECSSVAASDLAEKDASRELTILVRAAARRWSELNPADRAAIAIPAYFGGSYFSFRQAADLCQIDATIMAAELSAAQTAICRAAVLHAASEIVATVGKQFAQPMRILKKEGTPKTLLVGRLLADRKRDVGEQFEFGVTQISRASVSDSRQHEVRCADYLEVLQDRSLQFDCVYADPPYTIDHYSRFYHVLETIARRDQPSISVMRKRGTVVPMRGLYRTDRVQSAFCIPSQARTAFIRLFEGVAARKVPLVLSYSPFSVAKNERARLLTLDELMAMARKNFRHVEQGKVGSHSHRRLNAEANNVPSSVESETLIICR